MSEDKFYVYVHRRTTDNRVFYVGKGRGNRAHIAHRNPHWRNVANKHGFKVQFVDVALSEAVAFELEIALIALCGRENLTNKTDGGEGQSNPSQETRDKISKGNLGKKFPESAKAAMREKLRDKPKSAEARAKMSLAAIGNKKGLGKKASAEARMRLSEARKGMQFSEAHCANLSRAHKGNKSALGHVVTEENKRKHSELIKARWADPETRAALIAQRKATRDKKNANN